MRDTMNEMWQELDTAWLGFYKARSPAELKGPCNSNCAKSYWSSFGYSGLGADAPVCGVPGCAAEAEDRFVDRVVE
jgi:hypothetical protein